MTTNSLRMDLAPTGKLRVGINYGNPVLAKKDSTSGDLHGVAVDLARELARRADEQPFRHALEAQLLRLRAGWGRCPVGGGISHVADPPIRVRHESVRRLQVHGHEDM